MKKPSLDTLIEQALNSATSDEKNRQKMQAKKIVSADVKNGKNKKETSESEDEETKTDGNDESAKKITTPDPLKDKQVSQEKDTATVPGTQTSKKLNDPPPDVLAHPDFAAIRNKINTLRGGGSLAKEPVKDSVKEYISTLSQPEKAALLTYLTNLSQLMAATKKPSDVKDPGDVGIHTKFEKNKMPAKTEKNSEKTTKKEPQKDEKKSDEKDDVIVVGEGKNGLRIFSKRR